MSKNLIPEIAKMLGVEMGEEFKIKGFDELIYKFADDGLRFTNDVNPNNFDTTANVALTALLNGKNEIVKLPWKPKRKDKYWTFYRNDHNKLDANWNIWTEEIAELARLKAGWVFRTKEEAEAALPKVAAEMGVEYAIERNS